LASSKYALGIFEDGNNLYVACLVKEDGQVKIINTEVYDAKDLSNTKEETTQTGEFDSAEALLEKEAELQQDKKPNSEAANLSEDDIQLTMGDDDSELSLDDEVLAGLQQDVVSTSRKDTEDEFLLPGLKDETFTNYPELLYRIINRNPGSAELAFAFQEPKVYYTNFYTDWGLDGPKLKQKVIQELSTEQSDFGVRIPDSVGIIRSASGELITVASDVVSDFKSIHKEFETKFSKHLPHISFIESDVVSLVNLMSLNYEFSDEEITVIIYVGLDHTRLIFLQGNQLLHISPILNEGTDSILVFETIYNKIMLEQDSLNLQKIDRIYTAGEAGEMGVKAYMSSMFTSDGQKTVEDIQLKNLVVYDTEKFSDSRLSQYAIPIGAAWRALEKKDERLVDVDLTPSKLRESQKILKLGVSGWAIIALIFLLSLFFSWKVSSLKHDIITKKNEITIKQKELDHLKALDQELSAANVTLDNIKKTYSVLDSMLSKTKDFNKFLNNLSRKAKYYGGIWITNISQRGEREVGISGFSIYRTRISGFAESLGHAELKKVQTTEIRQKTVYQFELMSRVPYKEKYAKPEVIAKAMKTQKKKINNIKSVSASKPAGNINTKTSGLTIQNERQFQVKYEEARRMFNGYNYKGAVQGFDNLINIGFQSKLLLNCYYWKGESYFGLKNYDQAIGNFKYVAQRQSGKKSSAIFMLGRCYAAKGDYYTSKKYMDQVINQYPNEPLARKASNFKRKLR
jgi:TolA-binding protein